MTTHHFDIRDANEYGINAAILLHNIRFWIAKNKANEKHLYDVLNEYIFEYYNASRTHMSLEKDSPEHRPIQKAGKIVSKPILGGLHHVYSRVA